VYVRYCPQQLEVPACLLAHIQQKQCWMKGFMQVFCLFYRDILLSRDVPFAIKFEVLTHLTSPLQLVFKITCLITYPYLVFHGIDSYIVKLMTCAAVIKPVVSAVHTIFSKVPGSNQSYSTWWSCMAHLLIIFPYFALCFGMILFEMKSILKGLFSCNVTLLVAPKEGSEVKAKVSQEKLSNKVKCKWVDDLTAFLGLCLAFHQAIYIFFIDSQFHLDSYSYVFLRTLNLMVFVGLVSVNGTFLVEKHLNAANAIIKSVRCRPALLFGVLVLLTTNSFVAMLQWVSRCN